jgi:hypothetical protein
MMDDVSCDSEAAMVGVRESWLMVGSFFMGAALPPTCRRYVADDVELYQRLYFARTTADGKMDHGVSCLGMIMVGSSIIYYIGVVL